MADKANKGDQAGLTRHEVADRFNVSVSTVRAWQRKYGDWLDVKKQKYGGGRQQATTYSDKDVLVFQVVHRLSGPPDHLNVKEVKERLDSELLAATLDVPEQEVTKEEQPPQTEEEGPPPGSALVVWTKYSAVVASLQGAEGKLEAVTEERDWLRERVDRLEDKLDEERQKSWLKKLFRR